MNTSCRSSRSLRRSPQPLSVPVPDWLTTFAFATATGCRFPLLYVQPFWLSAQINSFQTQVKFVSFRAL
nr:hypothetical protein CFP56_56863 [Quercus suber]